MESKKMCRLQQLGLTSSTPPTLPDHLIFDHILPKLPVKTLIHYKSVSKLWHSVISSANFAKSHLNFHLPLSNQCIVLNHYNYELLLLPYDESHNLKSPIPMEFKLKLNYLPLHRVLGMKSCNGLLCLYNSTYYNDEFDKGFFFICNPSLRQYSKIPIPEFTVDLVDLHFWFGCTSNSCFDDYKIVAHLWTRWPKQEEYVNSSLFNYYVYSLRTGEWKRNYDLDRLKFHHEELNQMTIVVDDILYLSLQALDDQRRPKRIFGFDVVNEKLKEFPWMDWLSEYDSADFFVMNGCLSLLCNSLIPNTRVSDIWMLKQRDNWSCWEKLSFIKLGYIVPFSVSPYGKFLLLDYGSEPHVKQFKIIDPSKYTQEQSQGDAYICNTHTSVGAASYVESLISPFGTIKSAVLEDGEV